MSDRRDERIYWMCATSRLALGLAAALLASAGCARRPVPVEGVVTLNAKPLARAAVAFVPDDETEPGSTARPAYGVTDVAGRFSLRTINEEGGFAGLYRVTVKKTVYPPGVKEPTTPGENKQLYHLRREGVPDAYTTFEKTPLRVEVPGPGKTDIHIDLASGK